MVEKAKPLHADHRQRMRERFEHNGFTGFQDHEILEMLLYYAVPRKDTNPLAHKILNEYKTLANVFDADITSLMRSVNISYNTACLLAMIPQLSARYDQSKAERCKVITGREELGKYCISLFKGKRNEEFALICLDGNRRVQWSGIIIKGTIDRTEAYPRLVVIEALRHNAQNVVLAHNHPDGTLYASEGDRQCTRQLTDLLSGVGVKVLDHMIVSDNRFFSLAESGFHF